jgi:hypothetical protein
MNPGSPEFSVIWSPEILYARSMDEYVSRREKLKIGQGGPRDARRQVETPKRKFVSA